MSTPAIWSFVVVAISFVGVVVVLVRACVSTYRRGRRLAEELTALGVDIVHGGVGNAARRRAYDRECWNRVR